MATTGDTPAPRSGHSMVVYQNSLIIFGGWSGSYRRYNDVHQLSLETRTWVKHQPSGPIPKQRSFPFSLLSLLLPLFVYPASTFILLIVLYHFYLSLCYHQMNPWSEFEWPNIFINSTTTLIGLDMLLSLWVITKCSCLEDGAKTATEMTHLFYI